MKTFFAFLLINFSVTYASEQNPTFFLLSSRYGQPFEQYLRGPQPYMARPIVGLTSEAKSFISFIPKLELQKDGTPVLGCTGISQVQGNTLAITKFKVCIRSIDRVALYRNRELSPSEIGQEERLIRDAMEELKFATPEATRGKVYWNKSGPAEVPVHHPSTKK